MRVAELFSRNPIDQHLLRPHGTCRPCLRRHIEWARRIRGRKHRRRVPHVLCITQHRTQIGHILRECVIDLHLNRREIDRMPRRAVLLPHEKGQRAAAVVRVIETAQRRIHIDGHRMGKRRRRPRRLPVDARAEMVKAERRGECVLHGITAHHNAPQGKAILIGADKVLVPHRGRTERRHNELVGGDAEIRKTCRRKNGRCTAETVPREIELFRGMRAQIGSEALSCRLSLRRIRKECRLTVVEEPAVNQRHPAPLFLWRIAHREELRRRVPAERRSFHPQIRPYITAALRPGKSDEMQLCPIGITTHHVKETSNRSAVPHGLSANDLPSRHHQPRTQELRELPAVGRLGRRRLDKEERGEIRGGGEGTQRKAKHAEENHELQYLHQHTSHTIYLSLLYLFSLKFHKKKRTCHTHLRLI